MIKRTYTSANKKYHISVILHDGNITPSIIVQDRTRKHNLTNDQREDLPNYIKTEIEKMIYHMRDLRFD